MRFLRTGRLAGVCLGVLVSFVALAPSSASALCGDGVTTTGEACDAGTPICQGGKNAGSECNSNAECDSLVCSCTGGSCVGGAAGTGNRDDTPNACRSTCMNPMCGDGVSDSTEQCDNGAANGNGAPCYGNAPKSVCSNATGLTIGVNALLAPSGILAMVPCDSDGDCVFATQPFCRGNPQCRVNVCGDGVVCSDAACTSGRTGLLAAFTGGTPGLPAPEACDDGNTSNTDSCLSPTYSAALGTASVPLACNSNICGDGTTSMGVEQCDAGFALCITGAKVGKPCAADADCKVGDVLGICSGGGASTNVAGFDNRNDLQNCISASTTVLPGTPVAGGNLTCDGSCTLPFCGDGVSDQLGGDCVVGVNTLNGNKNDDEQCDDGTTANGQGQFCNKIRTCMGGENPGALCTSNSDCIKGMCGMTTCVQNRCGDGILAGNEQCDDGNTVAAIGTSPNGDTCGVSTTVAAGLYAVLGCDSTTSLQNLPDACPAAACILPFCGDGVTNPGEMCDDGACVCGAASYNPGALCNERTDCKPLTPGADVCGPSTVDSTGSCNDDETSTSLNPDACRSNCMPPSCGDGVSDANEQCDNGANNGDTKPCISSLACTGLGEPHSACTAANTTARCVLAECGDGKACTDASCVPQTGPFCNPITGICYGTAVAGTSQVPEQCDDGNTVDPSTANLDACRTICAVPTCGDGVTNIGEQCDSAGMGCSNMQEDLSQPEMAPDCCIDGDVVSGDKVGQLAGLLSVEQGFNALLGCRLPNLVAAGTCDRCVSNRIQRVVNKVHAAQVYFENNDVSKARRVMRQAARQLDRLASLIFRMSKPGKPCSASLTLLSNQNANAADLADDIVAELVQNNNRFAP